MGKGISLHEQIGCGKIRDSSDNNSDSAYIHIMKQKLMLIRC
jgi:hypothetical protein